MCEFHVLLTGIGVLKLGSESFVSIQSFVEGLVSVFHQYDSYPKTGQVTVMIIEDQFGNQAVMHIDIGYLIAWLDDNQWERVFK